MCNWVVRVQRVAALVARGVWGALCLPRRAVGLWAGTVVPASRTCVGSAPDPMPAVFGRHGLRVWNGRAQEAVCFNQEHRHIPPNKSDFQDVLGAPNNDSADVVSVCAP